MKIASVNVNVLMPEKIDKDKEKKVIYYPRSAFLSSNFPILLINAFLRSSHDFSDVT